MGRSLMVQGTMSNAGKSLLVTGLCRILKQDGYRVAPFKSQNMALNSFITADGLEMGRAQVVQAEACGIEPDVLMNPILLKPTTNTGSQVIVHGEVRGDMDAREYFAYKHELRGEVVESFETLSSSNDVVLIEGAGSPAEINLRQDDFVNMGMARIARSPVLLAGNIDCGGVFAQLVGTLTLLEEDERAMVKGLIVNRFRGDVSILEPGLVQLAGITGKPVVGVVPVIDADIEAEDSMSLRHGVASRTDALDVAVIALPKISNFTDFAALDAHPAVAVRYVRSPEELGRPDMVVLPGTKSTIADLKWLRTCGLEAAMKRAHAAGCVIFGLCGGFQMLGTRLLDEAGVEGGGSIAGMGLLEVNTVFQKQKHRTRVEGVVQPVTGRLSPLSGAHVDGYEIHMGATFPDAAAHPMGFVQLEGDGSDGFHADDVYGTYLHGFFDSTQVIDGLLASFGKEEAGRTFDYHAYKETQYDTLATAMRESLDMDFIYRTIEEGL